MPSGCRTHQRRCHTVRSTPPSLSSHPSHIVRSGLSSVSSGSPTGTATARGASSRRRLADSAPSSSSSCSVGAAPPPASSAPFRKTTGSIRADVLSVTPLVASSSRKVGSSAGSVARSTSRKLAPRWWSRWRARVQRSRVLATAPHDDEKTTSPPASTSSAASATMGRSVAGLPGHAVCRSSRPERPSRRSSFSRRRACGSGVVCQGSQPWKSRRNSSGSAPASTCDTCTARSAACA